ncbi:MAG: trypsin-like peptidase domain-containing protein, partial [Ferruginibacter sp.]
MLVQKITATCLLVLGFQLSHGQEMGWMKAQAIRDNVVSIKSDYGVGFGFIVAEKDKVLYIVTDNHVVRGANDGGPKDKANVSLQFFTEQGSTYSGVQEETWLSSQREDLAVITINTPPRFKWRQEGFAPLRTNVAGTPVWYVGRDGRWDVSDNAGKIAGGTSKGKLAVEGFDIAVGMSGGIIISEY